MGPLANFRIGVDENGLGARLGPLVVTAVLARVDEAGEKALRRKLPKRIRADLDDSKRLVSHGNIALGEAWARVLTGDVDTSPAGLFERLSFEGSMELKRPCPSHVESQCWAVAGEAFEAPRELVSRIAAHRVALVERGIEIIEVKSSVLCTKRLNDRRERGHNRFVSDLHAMESLILAMRKTAGTNVHAICGKVGGIGEYGKFFGPLGGWLHNILEKGRKLSAYRFPTVGELHFVRDADASDALVMLASLVGKYVREILMSRIARHYERTDPTELPSGYHDPITADFVKRTDLVRLRRKVPITCFERARDIADQLEPSAPAG